MVEGDGRGSGGDAGDIRGGSAGVERWGDGEDGDGN